MRVIKITDFLNQLDTICVWNTYDNWAKISDDGVEDDYLIELENMARSTIIYVGQPLLDIDVLDAWSEVTKEKFHKSINGDEIDLDKYMEFLFSAIYDGLESGDIEQPYYFGGDPDDYICLYDIMVNVTKQ